MKRLIAYFKDCVAEMKKVVWPSRDEVFTSAKVVLISLVLFAVVLGAVDLGLAALIKLVFVQG